MFPIDFAGLFAPIAAGPPAESLATEDTPLFARTNAQDRREARQSATPLCDPKVTAKNVLLILAVDVRETNPFRTQIIKS